MNDQISKEVVTERFSRLLELQNRHCYESNMKVIGNREEILIEGASETARHILTGRTKSNRLVHLTLPDYYVFPDGTQSGKSCDVDGDKFEGRLAYVTITGARPYSLEGQLETLLHDGHN
jgi:tRNA-2-methylthio-N6-dimethylallyladenosine synthase